VSDPLDDPRATDLLAARPDDIGALAANFHAAAGESATTAAGLSAARNDGTWTGRAAEAFRRAIGRLPGELDRIRDGYSAVATALTGYEPELSRIQAAFVQVVADRADVLSRLGIARATADTARAVLATTEQNRHGQPRALAGAELAVAGADGVLEGYRRELATLTSRALALLDEFAAVRADCRDSIAAAQLTAPVRPKSGQGVTVIPSPGP
jgi:hypothetical protein